MVEILILLEDLGRRVICILEFVYLIDNIFVVMYFDWMNVFNYWLLVYFLYLVLRGDFIILRFFFVRLGN